MTDQVDFQAEINSATSQFRRALSAEIKRQLKDCFAELGNLSDPKVIEELVKKYKVEIDWSNFWGAYGSVKVNVTYREPDMQSYKVSWGEDD